MATRGADVSKQVESFRRELGRLRPLETKFVSKFNGLVSRRPDVLQWEDELLGETLLEALRRHLVYVVGTEQCQLFQPTIEKNFKALVAQTPQVVAERDHRGWTVLHHACAHGSTPTGGYYIYLLLQQCPDAASVLSDAKSTPLHLACTHGAHVRVFEMLVKAYPQAVQKRDQLGDTPLHAACRHRASSDVIQFLLAEQRHVCLLRNNSACLPLDLHKQVRRREQEVERDDVGAEMLAEATTAASRALTDRLSFGTVVPREAFGRIAAFVHDGPEEVATIKLALSGSEIVALFRREDVRAEVSGANSAGR